MNDQPVLDVELGAKKNDKFEPLVAKAPKKKPLKILYEDSLPQEYTGLNLPEEIAESRNLTIKALYAQGIASLAGLGFFMFRRLVIYFVINVFSFIFIFIGFTGATTLQKELIAAHSLVTSGIFGACWVYLCLEALFSPAARSATSEQHQTERVIKFMLALPYLIDLICGIISFRLTRQVYMLEEAREKSLRKSAMGNAFGAHENYDANSVNCCVCLSFKKTNVIYPCGHHALCNYCAQEFKQKKVTKCPLCQGPIRDIIKIYS